MWLTGKKDRSQQRDQVFKELVQEVRQASPRGRLSHGLRLKLERFSSVERRELVNRLRDGCTPLFTAAKIGAVEIVRYLLENCAADVEQRGVYEVPSDHTMHYVTPLWCAAVVGRLEVCRVLVSRGANVNAVSDTGSTAVRSACYMSNLDVVRFLVDHGADVNRPNQNGGTCLINSVQSVQLCAFLISRGADINADDSQFKTALHYAVQEDRVDTTRLLLAFGANHLARNNNGDDILQTACIKGSGNIAEYLLDTIRYPHERVADALELLGATAFDEHHDPVRALYYWRRAVVYRYAHCIEKPTDDDNGDEDDNDAGNGGYGEVAIGSVGDSSPEGSAGGQEVTPQPGTSSGHDGLALAERQAVSLRKCGPRAAVFRGRRAFRTLADLEAIQYNMDELRLQSLLVTERVLGRTHKDTIYRLMYRGAAYADSMQHQRCIDLWSYAIDIRLAKDTVLHNETCLGLQSLTKFLIETHYRHEMGTFGAPPLRYENVAYLLRRLLDVLPLAMNQLSQRPVFRKQQDSWDRLLRIVMHLLRFAELLATTTVSEDQASGNSTTSYQGTTRNRFMNVPWTTNSLAVGGSAGGVGGSNRNDNDFSTESCSVDEVRSDYPHAAEGRSHDCGHLSCQNRNDCIFDDVFDDEVDCESDAEQRRLRLEIERRKEVEWFARRLVVLDPRTTIGNSLLHLAVGKLDAIIRHHPALLFDVGQRRPVFPSARVVRLLLRVGARVEALNQDGSTPLHAASLRVNYREPIVRMLLDAGAHIDRTNDQGNQPYRMLGGNQECRLPLAQLVTLRCLAASKVRSLKLRFEGGILPKALEDFVRMH